MGDLEGTTFQSVIHQRVLEPLSLQNSGFEASEFPEEQLAIPYVRFEDGYKSFPVSGFSASNRLRSNVIDLAHFMALHMN